MSSHEREVIGVDDRVSVGRASPHIILKEVDLPAPFGPSRP